MSLLPYVCVLVNSLERVGDFLVEVFGCSDDQGEGVDKPVLHRIIQLSQGSSVILVQKDSCNESTLATFTLLSVKHIVVAVEDIDKVRSLAVKQGAQVKTNDQTERVTITISDGAEEVIVHVMDAEKIKQCPHDSIIHAMLSNGNNQEVVLTGTFLFLFSNVVTPFILAN